MSRRLLIVLLRFGAVMTGLAFLTLPLPVETMVSTHRWLGLGELPRAPIVEYLARSVSAFYGFHGVLLFLLSSNVDRFAPIITYIAVMNVLLGLMLSQSTPTPGCRRCWVALRRSPRRPHRHRRGVAESDGSAASGRGAWRVPHGERILRPGARTCRCGRCAPRRRLRRCCLRLPLRWRSPADGRISCSS